MSGQGHDFKLKDYFQHSDIQVCSNFGLEDFQLYGQEMMSQKFENRVNSTVVKDFELKLNKILEVLHVFPSFVVRLFSKKEICKYGNNELSLNINGLWRKFKLGDNTFKPFLDKESLLGQNSSSSNVKFWKILIKQAYFLSHFQPQLNCS